MAALTVQDAPNSGLADVVLSSAASGGDTVAAGPGVFLLIKNDDVSSKTVTIVTPGTSFGLAIADPAVSVAAGKIAVVPMNRSVFGATASITYSAVTSLTVAAVKLEVS